MSASEGYATVIATAAHTGESESGTGITGGGAIVCRLATDDDAARWDEFAASLPGATLGHAFAWKQVIERSYGKRTYFLVAQRGERWVGALPLAHLQGPLAGNQLVSLPYLDTAGPLATAPDVLDALQAEACALARRVGARRIELRGLAAEASPTGEVSGRATLLLPLPQSADQLWQQFSPKVRNQVRKAEKAGLRCEGAGPERLGDFYRVFAENMRDLGSPVHSFRFLRAVFDSFRDAASLYLTTSSAGEVVGGAIAVSRGNTVTVPWASSLRSAFPSCPNHCLYWKVLGDAAASGAHTFDFGRSHLDSGTFRFKTQWGAQPRPLSWQCLDAGGSPCAPSAYKPTEHGLLTRAWSSLPLWLANALGPLIRQQLSN